MAIYQLGDRRPQLADDCYIATEATVIGDVSVAAGANLWPGAVLRGDVEPIEIGPASSIQDGAVLHTDPGSPLRIGRGVTVGHQATLHGCTIGDHALVGMQAVVLNNAVIGAHSLVAAGALVTENKTFPERSLILGSPAKRVRELSDEEVENLQRIAERYLERGRSYRTDLKRID
ncbi:gamma carbonic anhydrase family protein [Roseimaritima sediminicola]|uniref:gamma carbonic anhydrase family protein n=1 Tax=Roseimaritima sediminicola TaxID=2662066 RepID=UPI001298414F|nr:gamma carbonic anhydrase family protein [Roseimaritima sediminicola]